MILDILEVDLLICDVICNSEILHVLSAEHPEVIQVLGHIHDGLSDLSKTESYLKEVITRLVSTSQLTLAQE